MSPFLSHRDYPPPRDRLRVIVALLLVPRELSIRPRILDRGEKKEGDGLHGVIEWKRHTVSSIHGVASFTGRSMGRARRGLVAVLRQTRAEGKLDRAAESGFGCCVYGAGAALAGNEDGHDDDADADADAARGNDGARRRNRRGRSALISLRSAPIFPPRPLFLPLPPLSRSLPRFILLSHFQPSSTVALSLSPSQLSPSHSPAASPHYHIDPTGKALCVPRSICFCRAEATNRSPASLFCLFEKIRRDIRCLVFVLPPLTRCSFAGILIVAPSFVRT